MDDGKMTESPLTLLAVHAHPDDECIGTGGVLAKYQAQGINTVVVYGTRGEAGDILNQEFIPAVNGRDIADIRAVELENALKVLKVRSVFFLGYRDSGMAGTPENDDPRSFHRADIEEATGKLVEIIRRTRPQVVVTYNEKGNYGHPDHIMANTITVRAFAVSGDPAYNSASGLEPWRPSKLYYTAVPMKRFEMMNKMAIERGEKPRFNPSFMGTPDDQITTVIDIRDFLSQKMEALACHRSQFSPDSFFRRFPDEMREEALGFEHFVCVRGCAGLNGKETSLFAGLV